MASSMRVYGCPCVPLYSRMGAQYVIQWPGAKRRTRTNKSELSDGRDGQGGIPFLATLSRLNQGPLEPFTVIHILSSVSPDLYVRGNGLIIWMSRAAGPLLTVSVLQSVKLGPRVKKKNMGPERVNQLRSEGYPRSRALTGPPLRCSDCSPPSLSMSVSYAVQDVPHLCPH